MDNHLRFICTIISKEKEQEKDREAMRLLGGKKN